MDNKINVPLDCGYDFFWVAEYSDGTFFPQFDASGAESLFGSIDFSRLAKFHFVNVKSEKHFSVILGDGCRLIALRRHHHKMSGIDYVLGKDVIEYVLGYQKTVGGVNFKCALFIDRECNVILRDDVDV